MMSWMPHESTFSFGRLPTDCADQKKLVFLVFYVTPWPWEVNWTYIERSEDVQEITERLMLVQFTSCTQGEVVRNSSRKYPLTS